MVQIEEVVIIRRLRRLLRVEPWDCRAECTLCLSFDMFEDWVDGTMKAQLTRNPGCIVSKHLQDPTHYMFQPKAGVDTSLRCPVCFSTFKDLIFESQTNPKRYFTVLDKSGHVACDRCLLDLFDDAHKKRAPLRCPLCRIYVAFPIKRYRVRKHPDNGTYQVAQATVEHTCVLTALTPNILVTMLRVRHIY
ncbi:hypothetical protein NEDG_01326 [Nematocida displodere]|uniref:RING-type domain-containing protein n=1 Tax=Nematocida displodere TaxID=1805483 RepID=A0A177EBC6_9MICR|nr:hypothetical protein NEDG_01326 [Nematocida displodere]